MSEYEFSDYYFAHLVPIWRSLFSGWKGKLDKVLEIGSYEGGSAVWMLENLLRGGGDMHCVDHWQGGFEHDRAAMPDVEARFDRNVAAALEKTPTTRVHKHRGPSNRMLAELVTEGHASSFDLVYVDGSHEAADVLADLVQAFALCRIEGLIICDDYLWNYEENLRLSPKMAIDSFVNCYHHKLRIPMKLPLYQMYLIKMRD
jgi:predicted O-methyltransferase YrrM